MGHKLLMATSNPHKSERFKAYLTPLGLTVVNFADIGQKIEVVEDGRTPEENALKKAKAGFGATQIPTFGVDYWFYIEGLSEEKQPGPYVRRIFVGEKGERKDATDDEMLVYYAKLVERLGGETKGMWVSAIGLVVSDSKSYTERFSRETTLTSQVNSKRTEGEPLNSLQIDPKSGKYFTDLAPEEWLELQSEREKGYIEFIKSHMDEMYK